MRFFFGWYAYFCSCRNERATQAETNNNKNIARYQTKSLRIFVQPLLLSYHRLTILVNTSVFTQLTGTLHTEHTPQHLLAPSQNEKLYFTPQKRVWPVLCAMFCNDAGPIMVHKFSFQFARIV